MNMLAVNSLFSVFGLGHTLVDMSVRVNQGQLDSLGIGKGEQQFVDSHAFGRVLRGIPDCERSVAIGGNVRNTLQGLAFFGDSTCYCSRIGSDNYGALVRANLGHHHIADRLSVSQNATGTCLILVSEDGDRSMITSGGDDNVTEVDATFLDDIGRSKIFYTSGYMLNHPQRLSLFEASIAAARRAGTTIAFDLADPKVVSTHREKIGQLISQHAIDILFGNAAELAQLFGSDFENSLSVMQQAAPMVVAKFGADGAIIITRHGNYDIPANSSSVIDTTGAGDMFAAGFLHGLLHEYPIEVSGYIGALVAGDVIRYTGVQLSDGIPEQIRYLLELHGIAERTETIERDSWLDSFRANYLDQTGKRKKEKRTKIQVCGIKSHEEARMLLAAGVDLIAFPLRLPVHEEDVSADEAAEIVRGLRDPSRCVLITYLDRAEAIIDLAQKLGVKHIQLHGDTTVDEIKKIKKEDPNYLIVKSLIVKPGGNLEELKQVIAEYGSDVDAFIIDTYDPETGATGATGKTQDWQVSKALVALSPKPVILAGGLNPDNVYGAVLAVRPSGITVHTGVEADDGYKDLELVRRFIQEARRGFWQNL